MRVIVIGGTGLLGQALIPELKKCGIEVESPTHSACDIHSELSIRKYFDHLHYPCNWCINCAAFTHVDQAETLQNKAYELNRIAPKHLASLCHQKNIRLLHISTDYVFDGTLKKRPYTELDKVNPINTYGKSKLEGEQAVLAASKKHLICRTSLLFDVSRPCFPDYILLAAEKNQEFKVLMDMISCPTYSPALSRTIADIILSDLEGGIYHTAGPTACSRLEFAKLILSLAYPGKNLSDELLRPILAKEWKVPAERPLHSTLNCNKIKQLGIKPMEALEVSIQKYITERKLKMQ